MKLKVENGKVQYLYQAGKDLVSATMEAEVAQKIVDSGKEITNTDKHADFSLCVDGVWFFPVEQDDDVMPVETGKKTRKAKKSEAEG